MRTARLSLPFERPLQAVASLLGLLGLGVDEGRGEDELVLDELVEHRDEDVVVGLRATATPLRRRPRR